MSAPSKAGAHQPIQTFVKLLSDSENEKLGHCALKLLHDPGMRIESGKLRAVLKRKGAEVDELHEIVRFPPAAVKETIQQAVVEEAGRRERCKGDVLTAEKTITFSWHTPFMTTSPSMQVSLGGGCPLYYDYKSRGVSYAGENDLIRMLHLAEGLPQIVTCGNAVHCVLDCEGKRTPEEFMPILGAATIAKNSSKPGVSALMSAWQLDYLVAMGEVVRGGNEGYYKHPVFININDTMPPLQLSRPEGEIIEALAARGLPVYILPMPLMGVAGPVTVFANAVIAVAEILGVWTAAKAVNHETPLECSVVSGVLDPRSGNPFFSGPEAIAIDLTVAQFFRSFGLRCGTGVGFIDAPAPGITATFERTLKSTLAAMCGESNYPAGILAAGNIFSPEQLMLDLDIGTANNHFLNVFDGHDLDEAVDLVRARGIGGFFMDTEHTVRNFRGKTYMPEIFPRNKSKESVNVPDPVSLAHQRWNEIIARTEPYHLPDDKAQQIDKIMVAAKRVLHERI
ncbi:MAG: trimethylamine methyltransferase family protein [Bacteroidales bacterium]|nr:trimethylamine methyltransferase family protein [Bacteroidales bacterium]